MHLFSLLEKIAHLNSTVQEMRDEINRLKGEQGKPEIRGKKEGLIDISSEKERKIPSTSPRKGRGEKRIKSRSPERSFANIRKINFLKMLFSRDMTPSSSKILKLFWITWNPR